MEPQAVEVQIAITQCFSLNPQQLSVTFSNLRPRLPNFVRMGKLRPNCAELDAATIVVELGHNVPLLSRRERNPSSQLSNKCLNVDKVASSN